MNILLVEPSYYSRYPPLGLMKIAAYQKAIANSVKLVRGTDMNLEGFTPHRIDITSLFTYAWKPVHQAISFYHRKFPNIPITVGGIYASLLPERIKEEFPFVEIQCGLNPKAEEFMPDYDILKQVDKWKDWDGSIMFTSRGCVNKCPFCMVPIMEGSLRSVLDNPEDHVHPNHSKLIIWDNNFLAQPNWKEKMSKLKGIGKTIDFNQGLDARLVTEENAIALSELKIRDIRMAYDGDHEKKAVHKAVEFLENVGFNRRRISFYTLYNFYESETNFYDTPESFYERVIDILEMGCVSYPMRFVPFKALAKNDFISPMWTQDQLEAVARARRVIGFGGSFPPYAALIRKFKDAGCFDEAFRLEPPNPERDQTNSKLVDAV